MNILVTNNHVIYNSHNPDIDHKKEPAKNPGDSDFFYRLCPVLSDDFCICVHVHNALCRASPISTRKQLMKTRAPRLSVNALYRASPISTHLKLSRRPHPLCVNALYRASPISTPTPTPEPEDPEVCQCPISGFSHFYDPVDPEPTPDPVVSMPYIGLLPFLLMTIKSFVGGHSVCQCPISGFSHFYCSLL